MTRHLTTRLIMARRPLRLASVATVAAASNSDSLAPHRLGLYYRVAAPWLAPPPGPVVNHTLVSTHIAVRPVFNLGHINISGSRSRASMHTSSRITHNAFTRAFQRAIRTVLEVTRRYRSKHVLVRPDPARSDRRVAVNTPLRQFETHWRTVAHRFVAQPTPVGNHEHWHAAASAVTYVYLDARHIQATSFVDRICTRVLNLFAQSATNRIARSTLLVARSSSPTRSALSAGRPSNTRATHSTRRDRVATPTYPLTVTNLEGQPTPPSTPTIRREQLNVRNSHRVLPIELRYRETDVASPVAPTVPRPPEVAAPQIDIDQLSQTVMRKINKKLRIERERRGLL